MNCRVTGRENMDFPGGNAILFRANPHVTRGFRFGIEDHGEVRHGLKRAEAVGIPVEAPDRAFGLGFRWGGSL